MLSRTSSQITGDLRRLIACVSFAISFHDVHILIGLLPCVTKCLGGIPDAYANRASQIELRQAFVHARNKLICLLLITVDG